MSRSHRFFSPFSPTLWVSTAVVFAAALITTIVSLPKQGTSSTIAPSMSQWAGGEWNELDERVSQAGEADYTVHEWGLVRFTNQPEIATSGFGHRLGQDPFDPWNDPEMILEDKPVIYLHPGPGFDPETRIDVTINLRTGTIREVWPTPAGGAQPVHSGAYTWSQVSIEQDQSCSGELAPSLGDPACISLFDGVCEASEMSEYIGNVDHCLSVGDPPVRTPVLLYNAYLPSHTRPVELDESARAVVNLSDETVGPLWVVFESQVYTISELVPGDLYLFDESEPAYPTTGSQSNLSREILEALMERGLTLVEAGQFVLAWSPNVLREPYPWRGLGLYHDETVERFFPLTLNPEPTEMVRVLAFSLE